MEAALSYLVLFIMVIVFLCMEHLYLISAGLCGFFIAILLSKRGKQMHDLLLIAWLGLILFHVLVSYRQTSHPYTFLLEMSSTLVFVYGPLLFFYTKAVTTAIFRFQSRFLLHLLPFLIYLLCVLPYLLKGQLAPWTGYVRNILALAKLTSILVYAMFILGVIKLHHSRATHTLSSLEAIQLRWIQYLVYGVLLVWLTGLISELLFQLGILSFFNEDMLVNIAVCMGVTLLGYYGFRQTTVFVSLPLQMPSPEPLSDMALSMRADSGTRKYQRSGLDTGKSQLYGTLLQQYMVQEKPYTDPDLSLDQLAEKLDLSPNHLSQIINEQFEKNFWDFVNEYRVKEIEEKLKQGHHKKHTLLAVALDAGFNSKASFNRAFKKFTGHTPSTYLKLLIENE